MNRIYIKSISVILSLAMVFTSADFGYGSTLFKTTSHAQRHLVQNTIIENTCIVKDPYLVSIPQSLGTIVEHFKGDKDSLIIHIQDRHIDPTAQLNIAGIVDEFISKHKVNLMCLEGASTELDTSFYDKFEDNDIKHKVSKAFVDFAIFTGAEHYKITNKDKYLIAAGVEDKGLYLKHLDTHKNTIVYQEGIINFLKAVNLSLNSLKDTLYTKDLKRIDNASISYSKATIKLPEYIKTLNSYTNKARIDTSKYPNLIKFINLVQREEKIDFKLAETQREAIIKRLSETLDRVELNELLRNSMDFRTNKLSQEEFYDYLFNLIDKHDFKVKEYSQLQSYRDYIKLSKDINHLKVFDEADDFEYELMIALSSTQPQKDLILYSKSAKLLQDLYSLKLTPRQLHYLEKHKDSSDIGNIKRFLITTSSQYGLHIPAIINSFNINSYIMEQSKQYYSLALERDTALIENTLQRMRRLRNDKAILVTGGFHTQGITNILKERGISYVVICPNICQGDYDAIYNDRIAGKLPSIERIEAVLSDTLGAPLKLDKTASAGRVQEMFNKAYNLLTGIVKRKSGELYDHTDVPNEFPMIFVDSNSRKLLLPDGNELVFQNNTIAQRLEKENIEVLSGEALNDKEFINALQVVCEQDDSNIMDFLKEHFVLAMSLSNLNFDEANIQLRDQALEILSSILGGEIERQHPRIADVLVPLIMSICSKGSAPDIKNFFRPINNVHQSLKIHNIPVTKIIDYLYMMNEAMEHVLAKNNYDIIAVRPFFSSYYVDLDNVYDRAIELTAYGIEQLLKQWDMLNIEDPQITNIFFSFGFEHAFEKITKLGRSDLGYDDYLKFMTDDLDVVYRNLTNHPRWLALKEILTKKRLVFDGTEYRVSGMRFLKNIIESGESEGKSPIFKILLTDVKTGELREVLCKWAYTQNMKYDYIATSISRMLGLKTYHVESYGAYLVNGEEFSWEMIEFLPHHLVAYTNIDPDSFETPGLSKDKITDTLTNLRDLGLIFAIEYALAVRDSVMKHILLSDREKRFFRIDWEYMFDVGLSENQRLAAVLQGDEKDFLKLLFRQDYGDEIFDKIIDGFDDGINKIQQDLVREDSQILTLLRNNIPEVDFEFIKEKLYLRLLGRSARVIRNEIGLTSDLGTTDVRADTKPASAGAQETVKTSSSGLNEHIESIKRKHLRGEFKNAVAMTDNILNYIIHQIAIGALTKENASRLYMELRQGVPREIWAGCSVSRARAKQAILSEPKPIDEKATLHDTQRIPEVSQQTQRVRDIIVSIGQASTTQQKLDLFFKELLAHYVTNNIYKREISDVRLEDIVEAAKTIDATFANILGFILSHAGSQEGMAAALKSEGVSFAGLNRIINEILILHGYHMYLTIEKDSSGKPVLSIRASIIRNRGVERIHRVDGHAFPAYHLETIVPSATKVFMGHDSGGFCVHGGEVVVYYDGVMEQAKEIAQMVRQTRYGYPSGLGLLLKKQWADVPDDKLDQKIFEDLILGRELHEVRHKFDDLLSLSQIVSDRTHLKQELSAFLGRAGVDVSGYRAYYNLFSALTRAMPENGHISSNDPHSLASFEMVRRLYEKAQGRTVSADEVIYQNLNRIATALANLTEEQIRRFVKEIYSDIFNAELTVGSYVTGHKTYSSAQEALEDFVATLRSSEYDAQAKLIIGIVLVDKGDISDAQARSMLESPMPVEQLGYRLTPDIMMRYLELRRPENYKEFATKRNRIIPRSRFEDYQQAAILMRQPTVDMLYILSGLGLSSKAIEGVHGSPLSKPASAGMAIEFLRGSLESLLHEIQSSPNKLYFSKSFNRYGLIIYDSTLPESEADREYVIRIIKLLASLKNFRGDNMFEIRVVPSQDGRNLISGIENITTIESVDVEEAAISLRGNMPVGILAGQDAGDISRLAINMHDTRDERRNQKHVFVVAPDVAENAIRFEIMLANMLDKFNRYDDIKTEIDTINKEFARNETERVKRLLTLICETLPPITDAEFTDMVHILRNAMEAVAKAA